MKRMILVSIHPAPSPQAVPLACGFLAAALAGEAVDVQLFDGWLSEPAEECADRIAALHPDAVGFSVYLWNRLAAAAIARHLRQKLPGCVIFCGGPEATAGAAGVLAGGCFDFVVAGEGEQTLADVCRCLADGASCTDLPGIATLAGDRLKLSPARRSASWTRFPPPG